MMSRANRMFSTLRAVLRCGFFVCALAVSTKLSGAEPSVTNVSAERSPGGTKANGLALPPRALDRDGANKRAPSSSSSQAGAATTAIALASIVGVLLVAAHWIRPYVGSPRGLPIDALELLGRRLIEPKVAVHLVRCGNRVLVLGVTSDGVRTLSEITDPTEVERLTEACLNEQAASRTPSRFRSNPTRDRTTPIVATRSRDSQQRSSGRTEEVCHE
jgi:flagellar protein FliO/FliZ